MDSVNHKDHPNRGYGWSNTDPTDAHGWILPRILELLPGNRTGLKVLDLGCGNGFMASRLSGKGFDVTGIDLSEDGIEIARKAYPAVKFMVSSVYADLSALVEEVDVVLAVDLIEHLYSPKSLMENAFSVLKTKGAFIVSTPYHGYLKNLALSIFGKWDDHHTADWEGGHIKFFSEKTLRKSLVETGFREISFHNSGRVPWLWKSMICRCFKP